MGQVFHIGTDGGIEQAAELLGAVLSEGGMAVFPTDTVYGIGLAPKSAASPAALFAAKRRPSEKAIPWLVGSPEALHEFGTQVPAYADALARRYWPGALTLVVEAASGMPGAFLASDGTIALRMPASPLVTQVCALLGDAVATTSANTSGMPPAASFDELELALLAEVPLAIDGGEACAGEPSTVVVCTGSAPRVVREGAIPTDDIMAVARGQADR